MGVSSSGISTVAGASAGASAGVSAGVSAGAAPRSSVSSGYCCYQHLIVIYYIE